jgi:hypothetical protein
MPDDVGGPTDVNGQPQTWDGMHFDDPEVVGGPRFCPRCSRAERQPGALCAHCGESLRAQGYCPVCERYWPRDVGSECPKHDIPLDPAPFPADDDPAALAGRWVPLQTYSDALAAEAPRLRLEAEGIPTFVDGSRMGSRSMYNVAVGGVRLLVPEPLLGDARVLLAQTWAAPPEIDGCDDDWEDATPQPSRRRRPLLKVFILVWIFGPLALWLLALLLYTAARLFSAAVRSGG